MLGPDAGAGATAVQQRPNQGSWELQLESSVNTKGEADFVNLHGMEQPGGAAMWDHGYYARPSHIPPRCIRFTRAGIKWRRCHHAVCMARPYKEPPHLSRAEP